MTYEIRVGGLSAATTVILVFGEKVKLSPAVNQHAGAILRRKQGALYGFEFFGLTAENETRILELCEGLRLF
jgi:hypothetical protein